MTAAALLDTLRARGVVLAADPAAPSGLRYRAPRGVVTPQVADAIRVAAPALVPLLAKPSDMEEQQDQAAYDLRLQAAGRAALSGVMPSTLAEADACPLPGDWMTTDPRATLLHAWDAARRLRDNLGADWYRLPQGRPVAETLEAIADWWETFGPLTASKTTADSPQEAAR